MIYKIQELQHILRDLSSDGFCLRVETEYNQKLNEYNNSIRSASGLLRGLKGKSSVKNDENELLHNIIKKNIHNVIGNAALSVAEVEERKLLKLQQGIEIKREESKAGAVDDMSLEGLEQLGIEVQKEDMSSANTVIKSRKGFI